MSEAGYCLALSQATAIFCRKKNSQLGRCAILGVIIFEVSL